MGCSHAMVACLNHYEIIRKYRCEPCGAVMMCACEEELARWAWPHQLRAGREYDTHRRVPVTVGFQAGICNTCRGLPAEAHPKAPIYRLTSKIRRYYWREILFETTRRFQAFAATKGIVDFRTARGSHKEAYDTIKTQVVEDMKELHARAPKYTYEEQSTDSVLAASGVEVVRLHGEYLETAGLKGACLKGDDCKEVSVEEWVTAHYERSGWSVLQMESVPVHALFGTMMWLLIQDPKDPNVRIVGFGERTPVAEGGSGKKIWTGLPEDFGAPGYGKRREAAIEAHLRSLADDREELLWNFDYWVEPSRELREYLWAHRAEDVARARTLLTILPVDATKGILRYLAEDYWRRYCGWPDLLVYRDHEYFLAEVKSSKDRLSEDQKRWVRNNASRLRLPFKLIKVLRRQ